MLDINDLCFKCRRNEVVVYKIEATRHKWGQNMRMGNL